MTDTKAPAGMMGDTAPERIIHREPTKGKPFYTTPVEYVRSDLYATQQATIDALKAKVEALEGREAEWRRLRNQGVFFVADPSYHGWSHELTDAIWDDEAAAADDFAMLTRHARAALGGTTNG